MTSCLPNIMVSWSKKESRNFPRILAVSGNVNKLGTGSPKRKQQYVDHFYSRLSPAEHRHRCLFGFVVQYTSAGSGQGTHSWFNRSFRPENLNNDTHSPMTNVTWCITNTLCDSLSKSLFLWFFYGNFAWELYGTHQIFSLLFLRLLNFFQDFLYFKEFFVQFLASRVFPLFANFRIF